ncbi:MAG: hypothetical protein FWG31_09520 [Oscillospiraceae bacterium]|nr:hypothetical protein [Oscillospiraceae bacterium]
MEMIKEYDRVRLVNGELGRILEILAPSVFLAEVVRKSGGIDTTEIKLTDIKSKFIEVEEPIS